MFLKGIASLIFAAHALAAPGVCYTHSHYDLPKQIVTDFLLEGYTRWRTT